MRHAKEYAVEVGQKTVVLSILSIGVVKGFREYVTVREGDPFQGLAELARSLPVDVIKDMAKEAREIRRDLKSFTMTSAIAKRYLATEEGAIEIVRLLMQKKQTGATAEDAWDVFAALGEDGFEKAMQAVTGTVPEGNVRAPAADSPPGENPSIGTDSNSPSCTASATSGPGK